MATVLLLAGLLWVAPVVLGLDTAPLAASAKGSATTTIRSIASVTGTKASTMAATEGASLVRSRFSPAGPLPASASRLIGAFTVAGTPKANVFVSFVEAETMPPGSALRISDLHHDAGASPLLNESGLLRLKVGASMAVVEALDPPRYDALYMLIVSYY